MIPFLIKRCNDVDPEVEAGYKIAASKYLRFSGMYPNLVSAPHYWIQGIYLNLQLIQFVYYVVCDVLTFYYLIIFFNIDLLAEDVGFCMLMYMYCFVALRTLIKRKDYERMLKMIGSGFFKYHREYTEEDLAMVKKQNDGLERVGKRQTLLAVFMGFNLSFLQPLILCYRQGISSLEPGKIPINMNTPLKAWTPYSTDNITGYVIAFVTQVFDVISMLILMSGVSLAFVGLCTQLQIQLELLRRSIDDIYNRAVHMYESRGGKAADNSDLYSLPSFQDCIHQCLKENIAHHHVLLKYFEILQEFYSPWVLVMLFCSAIIICNSLYMLSLSTDQLKTDSNALVQSTTWTTLFAMSCLILYYYCSHGQGITDKSDAIREAFYNSPWVDCGTPFRKSLIIGLTSTREGMRLSAASMMSASMATFSDVLSRAYSYFNLLRASH